MSRAKQFFYLNRERDAELVAFLGELDNKSKFIRDAIYEKMARDGSDGNGSHAGRDDPAAIQPAIDETRLLSLMRKAIRDELRIAQLTFGAAVVEIDEDKQAEAQRKLQSIFGEFGDEDEDDDE
jgi:hypothetical protein